MMNSINKRMTEQAQPRKEIELIGIKQYADLVNDLNWQIEDSLDFISQKDLNETKDNAKVANFLELMLHVYPSCIELTRQLKNKIDELPEFIEVDKDEL